MGAMLGFSRFSQESEKSAAIHARKGVGHDTTEGVRDRATVSLSPAVPEHLPVTRVRRPVRSRTHWKPMKLPPVLEIGEAVPSRRKRTSEVGLNSYDNGSSSVQSAMGRRSPTMRKHLRRDASRQVHQSWRKRIAAP